MNVAVVGCGVRGSIVAALLAGGGVEDLSLVDGGFVTEADVGASPLVFAPDLRASKPEALAAKLQLIAPGVLAVPFPADLDADNAAAIITGAELVVDCVGSDEVATALAGAAQEHGIELIAPPADYAPYTATTPQAVATAAMQASAALDLRP